MTQNGSNQPPRSNAGPTAVRAIIGEPFNPSHKVCGFYPPDVVSRQRDLTDGQKRLYERALRWAWQNGRFWRGFESMADALGKSARQVKDDMATLEAKGLMRHTRRRRNSNVYSFLWHAMFEVQPTALQEDVLEVQDSPLEVQDGVVLKVQPTALESSPLESCPLNYVKADNKLIPGDASQKQRTAASSCVTAANESPKNNKDRKADQMAPLSSSLGPLEASNPAKEWTRRELADVRRRIVGFWGREPEEDFEVSVMLRAGGASAAAVCELLDRKYANTNCRVGGRWAPRSQDWFLTIIENEFAPGHLPEPPAPPHRGSNVLLDSRVRLQGAGARAQRHLRLKAARKLGSWTGGDTTGIPTILCDEWTDAQVKAFRLLVNRSATWAAFDEELLALELQQLSESDYDLSLTGFDPGEIDGLLAIPDEERANAAPPLPVTPVSRLGDLWLCGIGRNQHRILCSDATSSEAVSRLLGDRKPILMVCDPPYGIELDSEWRDRAGLNGCGPAEASYMKHRTEGHTETTISGDTRADWSEAFELVPSLEVAYVWHASKFTREVLDGLLRIGFVHHQQIIWDKRADGVDSDIVLVSTRTGLVRAKGERTLVWQGRRKLYHLGLSLAEVHHGRVGRAEIRSPHPKACRTDAAPDPEPSQAGRAGLRSVSGQRHNARRGRTDRARLPRPRAGREVH